MKKVMIKLSFFLGAGLLLFTFQNCGELSSFEEKTDSVGKSDRLDMNNTICSKFDEFDQKLYYDGEDWRYDSDSSLYTPVENKEEIEKTFKHKSLIVNKTISPNYGIPPQGFSLGSTSINLKPDFLGYDGRRLIDQGELALEDRVYWAPKWKYVSNDELYPFEYQNVSNQ